MNLFWFTFIFFQAQLEESLKDKETIELKLEEESCTDTIDRECTESKTNESGHEESGGKKKEEMKQ